VLSTIFGDWWRLYDEKLQVLYSSPNIIRVKTLREMKWVDHVARMGEWRGAFRILVGRSWTKRLFGRSRLIWEDNIKMDFPQII